MRLSLIKNFHQFRERQRSPIGGCAPRRRCQRPYRAATMRPPLEAPARLLHVAWLKPRYPVLVSLWS
jgi:hypothetical protein